ncbi:hypothetical protein BGZ52_009646, partial [Haplosporangium bisporale]
YVNVDQIKHQNAIDSDEKTMAPRNHHAMELSSIFRLDVTVAEYLLPFLNTCGPRFQFENVHCGHFRNRNLSRDRFGTALTLLKYDGSPYKGRSTGAEIAEAISFNEHWTSMV